MADQAQESTLQSVLDQLRVSNELDTGHSVATERIFGSIDKTLEDQAKDNKKDSKEASEDRAETNSQLGFMGGILLAGQKLAERAAKFKKTAQSKLTDFAKNSVDGIKKAAGSLMDFLKKGLGLVALYLLFKAIQAIDIESLIATAKKIGEAVTGIGEFLFTLSTRIGAFLGIDRIKQLLGGKEGKLAAKLRRNIRVMFVSARIWIRRIQRFLKGFVGKNGFLSKIGSFIKALSIFRIPGLGKIMKFIKGAAKFLGKIFVPVTVIMALWEAVTGFMDGFANTEGNMLQKIIGGIGGAVKSLLDFFIFGIADMIQGAIVWLLELFGFDSAAVAVGDFNLVGRIKDAVFKAIDFVTELFSFRDTSLSGIFKSLVDILMLPLNLAVNFIKDLFGWGDPNEPFKFSTFIIDAFNTVVTWFKGLFAWGKEAGATEDGGWSISKFIGEVIDKVKGWVTGLFTWAETEDKEDSFIASTIKKTITGVKEWFGKMFKFDSASDMLTSIINVMTFLPNLVKDAVLSVTEWLLGLFGFDDAAKKVANAKEWTIGGMIMNAVDEIVKWLSGLFNFDIAGFFKEKLGALGKVGSKIIEGIGSLFGGGDEEKIPANQTGGPVGAGDPILVGEHGPELFVPSASGRVLPKMQTETAMAGAGGGAPMIINAPTSNVRNGSTSMVMSSSSINPMHNKYFLNG